MTDEEILDTLLDINLDGIIECMIEVMGEKYRDIIEDRLQGVQFYGVADNRTAIEYINQVIYNTEAWRDNRGYYLHWSNIDKYNDQVYDKIRTLYDIRKILSDKQKELDDRKEIMDAEIEEDIKKCRADLSDRTQRQLRFVPAIDKWLDEFICDSDRKIIGNDEINLMDLLFCINRDSLYENSDYLRIARARQIVNARKGVYESFRYDNTPIECASVERIKKIGVVGADNKKQIQERCYNWTNESMYYREGTHGVNNLTLGLDGKMKNFIGLRLSHKSNDGYTIHEIVHAATSRDVIGHFVCGLFNSGFVGDLRYFNEVITEWLAKLILDLYKKRYPPMSGAFYSNSDYTKATDMMTDFLNKYKDEIIYAIMVNEAPFINGRLQGRSYNSITFKIENALRNFIMYGQYSKEDTDFINSLSSMELEHDDSWSKDMNIV